MLKKIYDFILIKHPISVLLILFTLVAFLGFHSTKLEIDASAETLLLEDDKDLKFFREVNNTYKNPSFLVVTFNPKNGSLLDENNLNTLKKISDDFLRLENITDVKSILNVPLLQSPIKPISELVDGIDTIENKKDIDKQLVKKEFLSSPLYSNNLVSSDFKTTAIVLNIKKDEKYYELLEKRNRFLLKEKNNNLDDLQKKELIKIKKEFKEYRDYTRQKESIDIQNIRNIISIYQDEGNIFLGGVNMIANDIIGYVKNDLLIYGSSLILILIFVLWIIFKNLRWVIIPITICLLSVISTSGILGLFNWEVTVISSNFIALQLIITISIILHLIVRYRELNIKYKNASQYKLVINTVLSKFNPSFFAVITTITGFASLVLSSIQPVKNLGLMMSAGIALSLLISFLIFPIILILLQKKQEHQNKKTNFSLINNCIKIIEKRGSIILIASFAIVIFSLSGASKLIVENSFISYFKKSTEIYKGMEVIDEKLGGTTPLDVIIKFKDKVKVESKKQDDEFDSFEDEFEENAKNC